MSEISFSAEEAIPLREEGSFLMSMSMIETKFYGAVALTSLLHLVDYSKFGFANL